MSDHDAAIERLTKEQLHDIAADEWEDPDVAMGGPNQNSVDGHGSIPDAVVAVIAALGPEHRLARYGRVLAVGRYDFGPPAGDRLVVFCELGALVYFPEQKMPGKVRGVHWWRLPAIATAFGVK